jgi:hypothetical protein
MAAKVISSDQKGAFTSPLRLEAEGTRLQHCLLQPVTALPAEADRGAQIDEKAMPDEDVLVIGVRRHPMDFEYEVFAPAGARARQHDRVGIRSGVALAGGRVQECDAALGHARGIAE